MRRSEAITKLMSKVISPFEVIKQENYECGIYRMRAERLLEFIEKELRMLPPATLLTKGEKVKTLEYVNEWEPEK